MEVIKGKDQTLLPFVICLFIISPLFAELQQNQDDTLATGMVDDIDVGVILDMGSSEGKMMQSCISMAITDFYSVHNYYRTRVVFHLRDSKGQPLLALSSAVDLLENFKVKSIIGGQTSTEAKFLAELADKTKVPFISFSASTSNRYPYLIQIIQDETSEAKGIAAVAEAFKWRDVIVIHEDDDDLRNFIPYLVDALQEIKNIHIAYKFSLASSSRDDKIVQQLHKIMALQRRVVLIVHMSPFLTSRFFMNAKKLGMMSEGYAWIMTVYSMNRLHSVGSTLNQSMQGVVGLKSYIPASKQLHNFTSRWRNKFLAERNLEVMELSVVCVWAYDVAWSLAEAAETARPRISMTRKPENRESRYGYILLKEILQSKFRGLSGEFQFVNGKLAPSAFEIVNVIGKGMKRVGFWTTTVGKITRELYSISNHRRQLSSSPKGYMTKIISPKKLRIAVVQSTGFPELVNIHRDLQSNATTITGFCVDVFRAAIELLEYEVDYEFKPFLNSSGFNNGSYNELIYQIYLQNYDAAVGDITITANRSLYVDFTLPYTDLGVGMIALKHSNKCMWIFLKPLTSDLWLSCAGFFMLIGFVIWLIERRINEEFQGPISRQIGTVFWFSFSTLVFAHQETLLSNLSRFVMIVWMFVVLILTSSYTATLTSMITVQQIQLNSKGNYIGYQTGSSTKGIISNLNFKNSNLQPFSSPEEYASALSRGSKNGGVSAIIDEIPYIKIFLAKYSSDYSMIGSMSTTNGFAFAFRKGSPLVPDLSRAIAKLREDGKLNMMKNEWIKSQSTFSSGDTAHNVKPLTLDSFRGLFLITGVCSTSALAILYCFVLYQNWNAVKNFNLKDLIRRQVKFVTEHLPEKVFTRAPAATNATHPE